MKDNIKPDHYRKGEIDLFESWYRTRPFNEFRAIMESIAERYMKRDKEDRIQDLDKAMETLRRLKEYEEKEIERAGETEMISTKDGDIVLKSEEDSESIFLLKGFLEHGFNYLARDFEGAIWAYKFPPVKTKTVWHENTLVGRVSEKIDDHSFPEVKWADNEPTKIADLLATYQNGGEKGKLEVE